MDPREHRLTGARRRALLTDLAALVALPSVSGDQRHAADCRRTAAWLARRLAAAGPIEVAMLESGGPPVVVGRTPRRPGHRSVLVYAHYDVQPADPRGWTSPPFRLTVRGKDAVGRGSADDKGPLLAHIAAVEHLLVRSQLPVDVTFLLDGEEEIGSPHFAAAIERLPHSFRPDVMVLSDTRMAGQEVPALVSRLRGSATLDLALRSGSPVLHAGAWGGAVRGAAGDMAALLSSLHAPDGSFAVHGMDRGRRAPDHTLRAALTVTCLRSGGAATAIPNEAHARLNLRTVVGEDPVRVASAIADHLRLRLPRGAALDVRRGVTTPAVEADVRGPAARAAAAAYRDAFGRLPVVMSSGGTIAAVAQLKARFGVPVVLMGFTPPDARIHAPDERMHLPVLWRAVTAAERFHHHLASS